MPKQCNLDVVVLNSRVFNCDTQTVFAQDGVVVSIPLHNLFCLLRCKVCVRDGHGHVVTLVDQLVFAATDPVLTCLGPLSYLVNPAIRL